MQLEHNWKHKTLEILEEDAWPALATDTNSYLVITCIALRKKQLEDFTIEDLRIMIGQNISLKYLMPLAIEALGDNILAEGDYYEGDLLKSILICNKEYWAMNPENLKTLVDLFEQSEQILREFDTTEEIKKGWFNSFEELKEFY